MEPVSVAHAAKVLGVSPRRVRALIGAKRLPAVRLGRRNWALDAKLLRSQSRSSGGHPLSADNAWGALALLSGSEAPWLDPFSLSRIKRRVANPKEVERALQFSAPRAAIYKWRVLPGDLAKLQDYDFVRSGLAAPIRGLDIVPINDEVDGYVSAKALAQIERRFRPAKSADNPNVILRVPSQQWILSQGKVAPPAVVAADLLAQPDRRVARAGRRLLEAIARR